MLNTPTPTMTGAVLPGNSTVELRQFPVPEPGEGQARLRMKASSICGSDIRAIYRAHLGTGPEGYQPGTIAGHEPCGVIEAVGQGVRRFKVGDRVAVHHIGCCGLCHECRAGWMISCHAPSAPPMAGSATAGTRRFCWPMRRCSSRCRMS